MKKIFLSVLIVFLFSDIIGQNHFTGLKEIKKGDKVYRYYQKIPNLVVKSKIGNNEGNVSYVDNSKSNYFPPIINQDYSSCAYASGLYYIYTYELNRRLDRDSRKKSNLFDYMFLYALQNMGIDQGGFVHELWDLMKITGAPQRSDFTGRNYLEWMSGADKYINALSYSVKEYNKIDLFPNGIYAEYSRNAMETAKEYLRQGGVLQFSAYADPLEADTYTNGSESNYKAIIPKFGETGMHSMTIVGYDDTVWWDYDGDEQKDDKELGAFICVNSWGSLWGDNGRFYAPYYTFTHMYQGEGGTGNGDKIFFSVVPEVREITHVLKIRLRHSSRNDISFNVGVSRDADATEPVESRTLSIMNQTGGDFPMRGKDLKTNRNFDNAEEIEVAFDISDLAEFASTSESPKFFLEINNEGVGQKGEGEILFCSLLDTKNNKEYIGDISQSSLVNTKSAKGTININSLDFSDGINTITKYFFNQADKTLDIYFTSQKPTNVQVDLMNENGEIEETLYNNGLEKGLVKKTLDLAKFRTGEYAIRINADNSFIYKRIRL